MVKALKAFKTYVLHSKTNAYVSNNTVKDILVQSSNDGKRGKWLDKIQEYDLEIKPTKLIKGLGLARLLAKSNLKVLGINHISEVSEYSSL